MTSNVPTRSRRPLAQRLKKQCIAIWRWILRGARAVEGKATRDYRWIRTYHRILTQREATSPRRPTFLGVGPPRTATTSLYRYLNQHPEVALSPVKEIHYFGQRSSRHQPHGMSLDEYLTYFLFSNPAAQAVGEISATYFTHPGALEEIHETLPEVKIIITLRNPFDRAISHFYHGPHKHGVSDINTYFRQALDDLANLHQADATRHTPGQSLWFSLYAPSLQRALSLFGPERVLTLIYDDLIGPAAADSCRQLREFLNISPTAHSFPHYNRSEGAGDRSIDPSVRKALIEVFTPDLERTSGLLGRDLTGWISH